jgi:hypothetical protein
MKIIKDKIERKLKGEQLAAELGLALIPAIEKHFKPFDGEKAFIQPGRSAKFNKVVKAFEDDIEPIVERFTVPSNNQRVRVYVDSSRYSISIKLDVTQPEKEISGGGAVVDYYKEWIYIAQVGDSVTFEYDFKEDETRERLGMFGELTVATIKDVIANVKRLNEEIDKERERVPSVFRDMVDRGW